MVLVNMVIIIDEKLVIWLVSYDYFYIMYWFDEVLCIFFMIKMKEFNLYILIFVGVKL